MKLVLRSIFPKLAFVLWLLPAQIFAADWKLGHTVLSPKSDAFTVSLSNETASASPALVISKTSANLQYGLISGRFFKPTFTINSDNQSAVSEIRKLIESYQKWGETNFKKQPWQQQKPDISVFRSSVGDCAVQYEASSTSYLGSDGKSHTGNYRNIKLIPKEGDIKTQEIPHPEALFFALESLNGLKKLFGEAISLKEKKEVAEKQQAIEAADAELEASRVKNEAYLKALEELEKRKLEAKEYRKHQEEIEQAEAARKATIAQEVADKESQKKMTQVAKFFASERGKELANQIEKLKSEILKMEKKEKEYLQKIEEQMLTYAKTLQNSKFEKTQAAYASAMLNHKDSRELREKKQQLASSAKEFQDLCGYSYTDALVTRDEMLFGR